MNIDKQRNTILFVAITLICDDLEFRLFSQFIYNQNTTIIMLKRDYMYWSSPPSYCPPRHPSPLFGTFSHWDQTNLLRHNAELSRQIIDLSCENRLLRNRLLSHNQAVFPSFDHDFSYSRQLNQTLKKAESRQKRVHNNLLGNQRMRFGRTTDGLATRNRSVGYLDHQPSQSFQTVQQAKRSGTVGTSNRIRRGNSLYCSPDDHRGKRKHTMIQELTNLQKFVADSQKKSTYKLNTPYLHQSAKAQARNRAHKNSPVGRQKSMQSIDDSNLRPMMTPPLPKRMRSQKKGLQLTVKAKA